VRSRRTPSSNFVFRLGGGTEDNDLHVRRVADAVDLGFADDDPCAHTPAIASVWEPYPDERAAIACGANVELVVIGVTQPPVSVRMTREQPLSRPERANDGPAMWAELGIELARDAFWAIDRSVAAAAEGGEVARAGRLEHLAHQFLAQFAELERLEAEG
jgi:hypothetical protein